MEEKDAVTTFHYQVTKVNDIVLHLVQNRNCRYSYFNYH